MTAVEPLEAATVTLVVKSWKQFKVTDIFSITLTIIKITFFYLFTQIFTNNGWQLLFSIRTDFDFITESTINLTIR